MPECFVSYASVDRPRTMQIVEAVQAQGLEVWIDQAGIAGGTSYGTEIANALRDAEAVLLIASDASLASKNVRQEIMLAWRYDKPIIPLILHPLVFPDDVAYWLEGSQWIEVLDREASEWMPKLRQALARHGLEIAADDRADSVAAVPIELRGNLPKDLPPILGRAREIDELLALLGNGRALTLTGPGGTGKTRLAVEVARRLGPSYPGGAWFVELASISTEELVLPEIAAQIGVGETPGQSTLESIDGALGSEPVLMVLDNLEQIASVRTPVNELLNGLPNLRLLATSRAALGVASEWVYAVPQLALPNLAQLPLPSELAENPAVRLFVERAQLANPGFQINDGNARAIAEICHRLDGLPLAIELAAARARMLPPAVMLTRLGSRLNLLTRGSANSSRQQTLRDTISWSYNLLDPTQQSIFRAFSVFNGGASLEAAESIGGVMLSGSDAGDSPIVVDLLEDLVDQAMLAIDHGPDGLPRLRMLETIREYGLELLEERGEAGSVREEHARFYADWLGQLVPELGATSSGEGVQRVRHDLGNLRRALEWRKQEGPTAEWWQLTQRLFAYWRVDGPYSEATDELEQVAVATEGGAPVAQADALGALGWFAGARGNFREAESLFSKALQLYIENGHGSGAAEMHYQLAMSAEWTGNYAAARQHHLERLEFHQEQHDDNRVARVEHDLGRIASFEGDYATAHSWIVASLETYRQQGDMQMIFVALYDLATVEMFAGDAELSLAHIGESLAIARTLHDSYLVATATATQARAQQVAGDFNAAARTIDQAHAEVEALGDANLLSLVRFTQGTNALGLGDLALAERCFLENLDYALAHEDRWRVCEILERLATIAVATGRTEQAARLLGRAMREREETGGHIPPVSLPEHEETVARAKTHLGDELYEELLADGRDLDAAILIG